LVQQVRSRFFFTFFFVNFDLFLIADIIELFEAFKEHGVQRNLTIVHLILAAWSISLMQFTLVVTSTKSRKHRSGGFKRTDPQEVEECFSCRLFWETELWVKFSSCSRENPNVYNYLLGTFDYHSFTRWSISLSSSWFNHSL
jgi:hypothetical protein